MLCSNRVTPFQECLCSNDDPVSHDDVRFEVDKDEFVRRVNVTVVESLDKAYDPQPEGNSLVFSEPKPAHEDVIRRVLCRQPM